MTPTIDRSRLAIFEVYIKVDRATDMSAQARRWDTPRLQTNATC